jgi:hypothetical protein
MKKKQMNTNNMQDNQFGRKPTDKAIQHITVNSGDRKYLQQNQVPTEAIKLYSPILLDNQPDNEKELLEAAIKGGRHVLPGSDRMFSITAKSNPAYEGAELSFIIYCRINKHQHIPVVFGRYFDTDTDAGELEWSIFVQTYIGMQSINMMSVWPGFDHRQLEEPPCGPWLGVAVTDELRELSLKDPEIRLFLSSAEQAIAITWRSLCEKGQNRCKGIQRNNRVALAVKNSETAKLKDHDVDRQMERLLQQKNQLENRTDHLKRDNADLRKRLDSVAHIQTENEHLRKGMSAKDEQIKVLEATNSELLSGIQQRADAQVSEIRKQNAERKDLIELLEKDRDNQKKKAEKLERKLKYTEQHLRRHGLSSEMFRAG